MQIFYSRTAFLFYFLWGASFSFLSVGVTFSDPVSHFSFVYDESLWEVAPIKTNEKETLLNLQRKIPDKEGDTTYFSRISVVKEDLSKNQSVQNIISKKKLPVASGQLQAYQSHAADFLRSQRFDILSSDPKKAPGIPGGAFELVANQRDFGLTFQQWGFVFENQAFLVTATVRTKKFSDYKTELSELFQSIKISP